AGLAVRERAENREAERVGPHVDAPRPDSERGAELRPQRFGLAHLPQIATDLGGSPRRLVAREFVIGTTGGERLRDVAGREHAGQHGVVRTLDTRHVDETGGATDQRAARKYELRHRLVAAFGDGARAVSDALAVREGVAHQRVGLEALKLVERRE